VLDGGAKAVGFDVIFPTSVERHLRGFDRGYLIALNRAAKAGKVVLGKVQHQTRPISPFAGYSFAVGHSRNIRSVNLFEDGDGIIRRVPPWLRASAAGGGERFEAGMAMELAERASGLKARLGPDGPVALGGYRVPLRDPEDGMLVNFDTRPGAIPTYSLADLLACAEQGKTDYFRRHFAGKAVLVGAVLDVEDRKLTSMRFATAADGAGAPDRCVHPVMGSLYRRDLSRDTIPGVYLHATAVNNLLRGDALTPAGPATEWAVAIGLTGGAVAAVLLLPAWWAGFAAVGGLAAWTGIASAAFARGLVLPLLDPAAGVVAAFIVAFAFRFTVADRDKRRLRQAFALYLPGPEVERLANSETPPALGGESRTLTVFFSDIEGFTGLSESMSPTELVAFLNRYLTLMTDTIEAHGGIVDKYIGDAVVGVFGAPLENPDHARCAVAAALDCQRRLREEAGTLGLPPGVIPGTRIGINTGEMVIGNIGSARRFNYTVMGDAVNLAARLEGANRQFGTRILVSGDTAARCGDAIRFRRIGRTRVVGRSEPAALFQPLDGMSDGAHEAFEAALARFEAGDFAAAGEAFDALAESDPVARRYGVRATAFVRTPPERWDGVVELDSK